MTTKSTKKQEASTAESPQLPLPLNYEPVPDDAVRQLLAMLFKMATKKTPSIPAIKLLLDILKDKTSDPTALTVEDALKILQEHLSKAA
jgi:hypothetical protein